MQGNAAIIAALPKAAAEPAAAYEVEISATNRFRRARSRGRAGTLRPLCG
jgi:hypothetical protein